MKVAGIIFLVFAAMNLIMAIVTVLAGEVEAASTCFGGVVLLGFLGVFFIAQHNRKLRREEEKDRWRNGR